MGGLRFGRAAVSLVIALGLGSACATAGDGESAGLDLSEAGTGDDSAASTDGAKHDSASSHDSSTSVDASTTDTSTGDDSGGFDAATFDSSSFDSGGIDTGTVDSGGVDSSTSCATSCTMGCCDSNNVCHTTFTDQYCPTMVTPGTACEDCTASSATCFLDIFFYVCL